MNGMVKKALGLTTTHGVQAETVFNELREDFMKPVTDQGIGYKYAETFFTALLEPKEENRRRARIDDAVNFQIYGKNSRDSSGELLRADFEMNTIEICNFAYYARLWNSRFWIDVDPKRKKGASANFLILPYNNMQNSISFSFSVETLLRLTNLKVFVYNGQLDLIVDTPGELHRLYIIFRTLL